MYSKHRITLSIKTFSFEKDLQNLLGKYKVWIVYIYDVKVVQQQQQQKKEDIEKIYLWQKKSTLHVKMIKLKRKLMKKVFLLAIF